MEKSKQKRRNRACVNLPGDPFQFDGVHYLAAAAVAAAAAAAVAAAFLYDGLCWVVGFHRPNHCDRGVGGVVCSCLGVNRINFDIYFDGFYIFVRPIRRKTCKNKKKNLKNKRENLHSKGFFLARNREPQGKRKRTRIFA